MNTKSKAVSFLNVIFILIFIFSSALVIAADFERPMVVLTTSYNNKKWFQKNVESILSQDYKNFRVIYIDDMSSDGTAEDVDALVKALNTNVEFTLIRNSKRVGSFANIYEGVYSCRDEEIVISLDGDDWFPDNQVLNKINQAYSSGKVWMTHGSFVEYPNGNTTWSIPISKRIVKHSRFRKFRCPSHLRTFYAWLFKKIDVNDLMYNGWFFSMSWDQAMMFPMIEMAAERHAFIKDIVYVYNVSNPINDNKVDPQLQRDLEHYIRSKPIYPRLEKSPLDP